MKENVVASFIRDTYKTTSIIPYVITAQVVAFVLLHILELLTFAESTSVDLFSLLFQRLCSRSTWQSLLPNLGL